MKNQVLSLNPYSLIHLKGFELKLNKKIIGVLSFILIIALFASYIIQANLVTKDKYLIKKKEIKVEEIAQENKKLKINFAQETSLENIEKMAQNLGFKKTSEIKYIKILEGSLVTK